MAMLAGPRRKQKVINLRAKNNAWSNDNNKFGQRMLEKMGWSAGKGLGANENGIVEHVIARYKNDDKGLGFEDRNDQWTKHEDDFNALLANLSNGSGNDEKLHSGISLEVKSKKSKARVHYHKFTRGKDLTRYSEKDLANIFGKKSLTEKEKETEEAEEPPQEVVKTDQIFTEKGSMEDYFKNKLANFKSKSKVMKYNNDTEEDVDCAFKGFSALSDENESCDNHNGFGYSLDNNDAKSTEITNENVCTNSEEIHEELDEQTESKKLKKKKKKSKCKEIEQADSCNDPSNIDLQISSTEIDTIIDKVKKSKKSKRKLITEECSNDEVRIQKKISKNSEPLHVLNAESTENYVHKKKKKKNKKDM